MSDQDINAILSEVATNQKWLIAATKEQKRLLEKHNETETVWKQELSRRMAEHGQRLGTLEAELYFRKRLGGVVKVLGGVVVLALTFKFGDIAGHITRWFK